MSASPLSSSIKLHYSANWLVEDILKIFCSRILKKKKKGTKHVQAIGCNDQMSLETNAILKTCKIQRKKQTMEY